MNDADWQDIFLILLNSYLHSHAANRKEIFKRLTDKLHDIRRLERQRSSDVYPSISIASPALTDPNEDSTRTPAGHRHYHFGEHIHSLRPSPSPLAGQRFSFDNTSSLETPMDSEQHAAPTITDGTSQEATDSSPSNKSSVHSLARNQSALLTVSDSIEQQVTRDASLPSIITGQKRSAIAATQRRYKITVLDSIGLFQASNKLSMITSPVSSTSPCPPTQPLRLASSPSNSLRLSSRRRWPAPPSRLVANEFPSSLTNFSAVLHKLDCPHTCVDC